jgi:hypothetical protein
VVAKKRVAREVSTPEPLELSGGNPNGASRKDTRDWIERSKDREYAHLLELQCTGKLPLVDLKDEEPWR